jgi:hypothetical protein
MEMLYTVPVLSAFDMYCWSQYFALYIHVEGQRVKYMKMKPYVMEGRYSENVVPNVSNNKHCIIPRVPVRFIFLFFYYLHPAMGV